MQFKLSLTTKRSHRVISPLFWACAILLLCNAACVNKIDDDDELPPDIAEANSTLTIVTRAGTEGAVISYPVHLYVFDNGTDKCVDQQTLGSASDNISFRLPAGSYSILAFAGATEENYNLPTIEEATRETVISLKDDKKHADLMASTSTVTLGEGEDNRTTIALKRKVMVISSAMIQGMPEGLSTVSLRLEPLYKSILLNGNYGTGTHGSCTLTLEKQPDGTTWKASGENYLLPGNATATITVQTIDEKNVTKSYSFGSGITMTANYKFNIKGTYTPDMGIQLEGTVSGDTWAGEQDITFNFDENGSSEGGSGGNEGITGEIPQVNTKYMGCYVLNVDNTIPTSATLTLMAPKEVTGVSKNDDGAIDNAITECAVAGLKGWRLPKEIEANIIFENYKNNQTGNSVLKELGGDPISQQAYFYTNGEEINAFKPGTTNFAPVSFTATATVRAVTTLQITKQ